MRGAIGPIGKKRQGRVVALLAVLLLVAASGAAAEGGPEGGAAAGVNVTEPEAQVQVSEELVQPGSPSAAVREFLEATEAGEFGEAARRLELVRIPESRRASAGPRLARHLAVVLKQRPVLEFEQLSRFEEGHDDDGLAPDLDLVGTIDDVSILLRRGAPDEEGNRLWAFSATTVAGIPLLYGRYGYGWLGELLPDALFRYRYLALQPGHWIALGLLILLAYFASRLVVKFVDLVGRRFVRRTDTELDDRLLDAVIRPARFLLFLGLFIAGGVHLNLPAELLDLLIRLAKGLAIVGLIWAVSRSMDVVAEALRVYFLAANRDAAAAAVPPSKVVLKGALFVLAVVAVLQNSGFDVTGLIAGLGVGGLAVALAAQKTVANLFGGVTLITDQPVRVGDFCRYGDKLGTVERIGLRSTRIRTLERTVVSVPNSEFAEIHLETFAERDSIRFLTVINLRYETTADQLRFVLTELRKTLLRHPRVIDEGSRVRFVALGAASLDLEVSCYADSQDWAEFLAIREDLLLRFMDVVEQSGSGFAFPSQTLYLGRDAGLDPERTVAAENQVREWRDSGTLPFPQFDDQTVSELAGSGDYPPLGSVDTGRTGSDELPGDDSATGK